MGCENHLGLGQKPGSEHRKSRQGDSTSNDLGTSLVAFRGSTATVSVASASASAVLRFVIGVGCGRATVVRVTRDPATIAQGLIP